MSIRFISIDPSTTFTGWAVFQNQGLIAWGVVDTRKVPFAGRFNEIIGELSRRASEYRANEVVIEDVKFAWSGGNRQRNIAGLQAVFRSVKDWAKGMNYKLIPVNPARWKNAVVGWPTASKQQTKENILFRFPNLPANLSEHEYDAIAIGVFYGGLLNLWSMGEE